MKLKVNTLSQRDVRWGSILLGYNTQSQYSIYSYGCLITTLGNYVGKQPDEVNKLLKDNTGFTTGSGNFIWGKSTVLGITQIYVSPYYNDAVSSQAIAKIKELITQGFPLVCEVDFNPADTIKQQHFVLLAGIDDVGNILVVDPWEGQWETWSEATCKRNIYQFRAYDKKLSEDSGIDPLRECADKRDSHWNDLQDIKSDLTIVGEYSLELIRKRIETLLEEEREYGKKEQDLQSANITIANLETELGQVKADNATHLQEASVLTSKVAEYEKTVTDSSKKIESLLIQVNELKNNLTVDTLEWWELIKAGIKKLIGK